MKLKKLKAKRSGLVGSLDWPRKNDNRRYVIYGSVKHWNPIKACPISNQALFALQRKLLCAQDKASLHGKQGFVLTVRNSKLNDFHNPLIIFYLHNPEDYRPDTLPTEHHIHFRAASAVPSRSPSAWAPTACHTPYSIITGRSRSRLNSFY